MSWSRRKCPPTTRDFVGHVMRRTAVHTYRRRCGNTAASREHYFRTVTGSLRRGSARAAMRDGVDTVPALRSKTCGFAAGMLVRHPCRRRHLPIPRVLLDGEGLALRPRREQRTAFYKAE